MHNIIEEMKMFSGTDHYNKKKKTNRIKHFIGINCHSIYNFQGIKY